MIKMAEILVRSAKGEAKIEILDEALNKIPAEDIVDIIYELLRFALEENPVEIIVETEKETIRAKLTAENLQLK